MEIGLTISFGRAAGLSLLTAALQQATRAQEANVYTSPAAFEAFIRGGGNVPLYQRVSAELASHYTPDVLSLLDIGCGDGHALFRALAAASQPPALQRLTVVEPAAALLASAVARAQAEQPALPLQALNEGLGAFTARLQAGDGDAGSPHHWDLAQATFALQAIPEPERWAGLAQLRQHVRQLVIVEFDIPDLQRGSDAYVASLAARYERALGEYEGATRDLVAQGFLIPMFLGQLDAQTAATNWEHPAPVWRDKLSSLGWRVTRLEHISDYFWAPAFVLVAEA